MCKDLCIGSLFMILKHIQVWGLLSWGITLFIDDIFLFFHCLCCASSSTTCFAQKGVRGLLFYMGFLSNSKWWVSLSLPTPVCFAFTSWRLFHNFNKSVSPKCLLVWMAGFQLEEIKQERWCFLKKICHAKLHMFTMRSSRIRKVSAPSRNNWSVFRQKYAPCF